MRRRVVLAAEAISDIDRLSTFLAEKSTAASERAVDRIEAAAASLAEMPERGRRGPLEGEHELVVRVGGGPYIIEYWISPTAVVVSRIWHAKEERRGVAP